MSKGVNKKNLEKLKLFLAKIGKPVIVVKPVKKKP